jgi:Mn2+/Fe2+ NRAMP family transporter
MMCARIGMVTGRGLTAAFNARFPRKIVFAAITALFVANTINVAADLAGMADAAEMMTHVSSHIWVIAFAVGISWATVPPALLPDREDSQMAVFSALCLCSERLRSKA